MNYVYLFHDVKVDGWTDRAIISFGLLGPIISIKHQKEQERNVKPGCIRKHFLKEISLSFISEHFHPVILFQ